MTQAAELDVDRDWYWKSAKGQEFSDANDKDKPKIAKLEKAFRKDIRGSGMPQISIRIWEP